LTGGRKKGSVAHHHGSTTPTGLRSKGFNDLWRKRREVPAFYSGGKENASGRGKTHTVEKEKSRNRFRIKSIKGRTNMGTVAGRAVD